MALEPLFKKLWEIIYEHRAKLILGISILVIVAIYIYKITKRIEKIEDLPRNSKGKVLHGLVTYVCDGDGFKMFHIPWFRSSKITGKLKTLSIRISSIDAPEIGKFGNPDQPFSQEAKKFLSDLILEKNVKIKILGIDRYSRILATVYCGPFYNRKNVSLELIKKGFACIYRGSDAIYDKHKDRLFKAEEQAKKNKVGMWKSKNLVLPSVYKQNLKKLASGSS
ncbi:putative endonuclease [Hamiltosporidium magnivora]|uniref:Putative endonuclease n=1 Tax=Hamiltosporidium magnivora TaxID=148818 RepID=A0A4Q9KST2_9MICR|nr:putative endonuclease [Hamiltosporidium magnivora]TBU03113.1 putative endonuclease [Hamiltosporidium magnivora]TBU04113.1 putative endonuclease [Hamiltosporidium magnivora]